MKIQRKHIGTSNKLRVISTNGTHGAHQGFSVEPGETYTFEIDLHRPAGMNNVINIVIWKNTGPSGAYTLHVLNTDGSNTFNYTATSSNIYIQIRQAGTYYLDNIRMYRTYEDTMFVSGYEVEMTYRYGFGGQEKDNEIYGTGNSYTAEFWQYDPRLGRRWNIDPMSFKYPWQSPYVAFNNNPIFYNDPLGLEGEDPQEGDDDKIYDQGTTEEISVYGKRKTSEEKSPPITLEKPSLFRRIMNKIKNYISKVDEFLSRRKRSYSPYEDRNKNPYETDGGIHGVGEGQGAENHRSLRTPETINYDMLFGLLKGVYRGSRVTQTWLDKAKKVDTSVDLFNKAEETVSDKMRSGSKTTGTGDMSGSGYGKLRPYANRDTVWRTETEQWWLYKKDTIIWDIDKNGNTRQPKFKTYHNHE